MGEGIFYIAVVTIAVAMHYGLRALDRAIDLHKMKKTKRRRW